MKTFITRACRFASCAVAAALLSAAAAAPLGGAGDDFDLSWHTMDGGGGTSVGGAPGSELSLSGTIGQPDAGVMSGGEPGNEYTLVGGFWAGTGAAAQPECTGDLNNSGTVDVQDLLALLSAWGPCDGACAADFNASGTVDVQDLLVLLGAWGPCPK